MTDLPKNLDNDFASQAAKPPNHNLLWSIYHFMRDHKKWWLLPIVIALLLLGLLVVLSGSSVAPFIYTLF
jgi:hypothetical protein